MKEIQIVKHANAVNLARRLSAENENDLVQVSVIRTHMSYSR